MTQAQFGKEARVDQGQLSRYELGHTAPSEEVLRRMAKVAGVDGSLLVHLRQFYSSFLAAVGRQGGAPASGTPDLKILEPVLLAITPYLIETRTTASDQASPEEERRIAVQIWTELEKHPIPVRRRLIELSPRSGSRALAERVLEASAQSAARKEEEARELAELALSIAEKVPGL